MIIRQIKSIKSNNFKCKIIFKIQTKFGSLNQLNAFKEANLK